MPPKSKEEASFFSSLAKDILEIYSRSEAPEFWIQIYLMIDFQGLKWFRGSSEYTMLEILGNAGYVFRRVPREELEPFLTREWREVWISWHDRGIPIYVNIPYGIVEKRLKWIRTFPRYLGEDSLKGKGFLALYPPYLVSAIRASRELGTVDIMIVDFRETNQGLLEVSKVILRFLTLSMRRR